MGGVIDTFSSIPMEKKILNYLGQNGNKSFKDVWENFDQYHSLLLKGLIDDTQFFEEFEKGTGITVPDEKNLYIKYFNPISNPKMIEIITLIKAKGYRIICGTNVEPPHRKYHESKKDYAIFDRTYTSDKLHLIKPNPDFFRMILKEETIKQENILFIDDTIENIEIAAELGFNTYHFKDSDDFLTFLSQSKLI
jgi:putative hydrolase of the HAD superfamily